jgi:O-antigen ligase
MQRTTGTLLQGAAWSGIAILLLLWPALGNTGAYLSLIALGVALPFSLRRSAFRAQPADWLALLLSVAFVSIAIPIWSTGHESGDAIYLADFVILLLAWPIALIFRQLAHGETALRWLTFLSAVSTVVAVCVGAHGVYIVGLERAAGTENSPIHFGTLAVTCSFFALAGLFVFRTRWRLVLLLLPLISLIAVGLSGTRGGLIVFAVLSVLFLFTLWRTGALSLLRVVVAGLSAVAAGATTMFILAAMGHDRPYQFISIAIRMVSGVYISDLPTMYRLEMYGAGIKAFFDSPVLGHGWHQQLEAAFRYLSPEARAGFAAEGWGYIHNELLGFALTGGILGIISFFALMSAPLVAAWAGPADALAPMRRYMALVLVLGIGTGGLTDVFFMSELPKVMLVVMGSAIVYLVRSADHR